MRQQERLFEARRVFADLLCWRCDEVDDRSLQLSCIGTWTLPLEVADSSQTLRAEQVLSGQGWCCARRTLSDRLKPQAHPLFQRLFELMCPPLLSFMRPLN